MVLVIGSTGKVGAALVEGLQKEAMAFRALAHSEASLAALKQRGVETTLITDQEADLSSAFAGVKQLFLLTPSSPDQGAIEKRYVDAAKQAGVHHIVKQSALGIQDPDVSLFKPHLELENYIRQSGMTYTFLNTNLFMQNLVAVDAQLIKEKSALFNAAGEGVISFIDTRDVAAVALVAFQNKGRDRSYDLTGPETFSYSDVAGQLTKLLGRDIKYVALTDEAYRGALESAGLSPWYARALSDLYRFYRADKASLVTDVVEQVTGQPARTLASYLAETRVAFE